MRYDEINHMFYSRPDAADVYASDDRLDPGLAFILLKHHRQISGQPVLDIGVGGGRTVHYLSRLTDKYVGIDYSESMVNQSRRRFPGVRIELADARDLRRFADQTFRFIIFSYNGISVLDHEGRIRALEEIRRVLQPGGLFAFSAHNRAYAESHSLEPRLRLSRNPFTQVSNIVRWMRESLKHARLRQYEFAGPEYALLNDNAHNYSLIHYYISPDAQREQLDRVGLSMVDIYDANGNAFAGDNSHAMPWAWYVARRPLARRVRRREPRARQTRSMIVAMP